ncbi:MAG: nuclear transport factor 2 family protein [Methylococcaceae bacterium]|nr:nuclear transport factor 2 family protein [Prolixibacteraceae bacterium]
MTKTQIAQDFLILCAKGQSREAFRLYVAKDFKHHNPYFKGDAESLKIAMEKEAERNPAKIFEVQRAMEENDLVAVHSHIRENQDDAGVAVVHIFRFEGEKMAEMWDIGQAVSTERINENGMF